jgi:hypothetical protein
MKNDNRMALACAVVWLAVLALASCSGAAWGRGADVALDAAECTLSRLIEEARRKGNEAQARRIEAVLVAEPEAEAR